MFDNTFSQHSLVTDISLSVSNFVLLKKVDHPAFQLERLQKENADEWGKRERIETERFTLERENKKLRAQIQDLEEQLERKSHHASAVVNTDMKTLQNELSEKNKVGGVRTWVLV